MTSAFSRSFLAPHLCVTRSDSFGANFCFTNCHSISVGISDRNAPIGVW